MDNVDLEKLFPHEYQVYRRLKDRPPEGMTLRAEFLGENGFANWLTDTFEQEERPAEE
jgi:hypothetical protein